MEQFNQMQNFISGLINWMQIAGELTDMIRSSSSETKILALNASIEAAKAGEKDSKAAQTEKSARGRITNARERRF